MAEEAECEELLQQLALTKQASVTGGLILKVEQFLKKPTIEAGLSEVLIEYLEHLRTSRIYLSRGVFTINFAECALLLQSASNLYAKKVDLLWDCIIAYQERNVLYEERSETTENEFQRVEERKERFKRKRKKKELEAPPKQEDTVQPSADVLYETIMKKSFDLTDDVFARLKEEPVDDPMEPYFDYFNNWYTFDNITQTLNRCPLLVKDIEKVKKSKIFKRHDFYEENPIFNIPIKGINADGDEETLFQYSELTLNYLYQSDEGDLKHLRNRMDSPAVAYRPVNAMEYCLQLFLSYYKIPMETIYKEYDRFLLFYKDFLSTLPPPNEILPSTMMEAVVHSNSSPVEPVLEEEHVTPQEEGESDCDIRADEDTSKMNRQDPIRKTTESSDSGFFDGEGECHGSEMDKCSNAESTLNTPMISSSWEPDSFNILDAHDNDSVHSDRSPNITVEVEIECRQARKRKIREVEEEDESQEIVVKPKRQRKPPFKFLPTHTATVKKFETFFSTNYEPAAGEGNIIPIEYSDSEDELDNLDVPALDDEDFNFVKPTDPVPENNGEAELEVTLQENERCDVAPLAKDLVVDDDDDAEEQFINYLNWKEFIEKKIRTQSEVQFDIHEEGTTIIESIGTIGRSVKYEDMCAGKSSGEVTRSFIAMLQLANTYNVEINNATGGTLANDTLELKLLTRERHHENLCEYQAPSEVTLKDRIKNAKRAANEHQSNHCPEQSTVKTYKKFRLG